MTFTHAQLYNFVQYVKVQNSNRFNMLTPQAARAASLTKEEMVFCIEHYDELTKAIEATL